MAEANATVELSCNEYPGWTFTAQAFIDDDGKITLLSWVGIELSHHIPEAMEQVKAFKTGVKDNQPADLPSHWHGTEGAALIDMRKDGYPVRWRSGITYGPDGSITMTGWTQLCCRQEWRANGR